MRASRPNSFASRRISVRSITRASGRSNWVALPVVSRSRQPPCGLFLKRRILVLVMTRGQKTKLDPAVPSRKLVKRWRVWVPVPQAWLEFDVESVESATAALESQGYRIFVKNKKEPR